MMKPLLDLVVTTYRQTPPATTARYVTLFCVLVGAISGWRSAGPASPPPPSPSSGCVAKISC